MDIARQPLDRAVVKEEVAVSHPIGNAPKLDLCIRSDDPIGIGELLKAKDIISSDQEHRVDALICQDQNLTADPDGAHDLVTGIEPFVSCGIDRRRDPIGEVLLLAPADKQRISRSASLWRGTESDQVSVSRRN